MANLINAAPQAVANVSPQAQAIEIDPKKLQDQFQKQLSDALNDTESNPELSPESGADLNQLAAAMVAQAQLLAQAQQSHVPVKTPPAVPSEIERTLQEQTPVKATPLSTVQALDPKTATQVAALMAMNSKLNAMSPSDANSNLNVPQVSAKTVKNQIELPKSEFQVNPMVAKMVHDKNLAALASVQDAQITQQATQTDQKLISSLPESLPESLAESLAGIAGLEAILNSAQIEDVKGSPQTKNSQKNNVSSLNQSAISPSSSLSTDSFLNLRGMSKNPQIAAGAASGLGMNAILGDKNLEQGKEHQQLNAKLKQLKSSMAPGVTVGASGGAVGFENTLQNHMLSKTIEAPVTQGAALTLVLSHDALHQIGTHVSQLNQAQQDGEIKLRLRPDHLGELQMSVKTEGQQVSIQIRAQDLGAKKIIEDSLSSLKDNLSQQNLILGKVEIVTQPSSSSANQSMNMNLDSGAHGSAAHQQQEQTQNQNRFDSEDLKMNVTQLARSRAGSNPASSGRLDMIA